MLDEDEDDEDAEANPSTPMLFATVPIKSCPSEDKDEDEVDMPPAWPRISILTRLSKSSSGSFLMPVYQGYIGGVSYELTLVAADCLYLLDVCGEPAAAATLLLITSGTDPLLAPNKI